VTNDDGRPPFDSESAASMVGKYVLIGMTYVDATGKVVEQRQLLGRIVATDAKRGITIELKGKRDGEVYCLPPDLRSFKDAPRGEYRLRSTGEVIVNPDLLTTWTINGPYSDEQS
jgi:hypothetical protein